MTFKNQINTLKENWLIAVVLIVVVAVMSGGGQNLLQSTNAKMGFAMDYAESAPMVNRMASSYGGGYDDFAPEVQERVLTKTASLSTEVERGSFQSEVDKFKSIVKTADGFILSDNVNKYGTEKRQYYTGYFNIKVDTKKYDAMVLQLKQIGEVQNFNENTQDITGSYTNVQVELETEKSRLKRFEEMYDEAKEMEDKITLSDRMFSQERTIKYLEDRLENMDNRVDYSTISVTISEKRSDYINVAFVKFSELIKSFVNSMNSLVTLVFVAIPWVIALGVIALFWKIFKKKRH